MKRGPRYVSPHIRPEVLKNGQFVDEIIEERSDRDIKGPAHSFRTRPTSIDIWLNNETNENMNYIRRMLEMTREIQSKSATYQFGGPFISRIIACCSCSILFTRGVNRVRNKSNARASSAVRFSPLFCPFWLMVLRRLS